MNRIQYSKKDFAWTRWTPLDIAATAKRVIAAKKAAYAAVKRTPSAERTFENTVYAIDASNHRAEDYFKIALLAEVSPSSDVRDAARKAADAVGKALVDIEYDGDVYRALKEYGIKRERLTGADRKLFEDMMRDFRRRGFDLAAADRNRLKKNLKELSRLGNAFGKNLNDYRDSIEIGADETAGLSGNYLKSLPRKDGKYVVTLDYPSYVPFMENADSEMRRRELSEKNSRKGGKENLALLGRMMRLREENAALLGYPTHADFRVENRLAKDAETVFGFLQGIMDPLTSKVEEDVRNLLAWKSERTGIPERELFSHDVAYLATRLKQAEYGVDDEAIREYFPLEHVKQELFSLFGKLLHVSFERAAWPLWHKDAELYAIIDGSSKERIAYFAFDLHPREGKYGHACVVNVITGHGTHLGGSEYVTPFVSLITNFPKASKTHPSLLSHDDLVTFLHEFGHLVHETLTEAGYLSQAGFSVAWDFVEAPSQMCEFFAWEAKTLRRFSRHYRTGKPLPPTLLRKLIGSKRHLAAYDTMRQAVQAFFDMMIHTGNLRGSLPEYYRRLVREHQKVIVPETSLFPAGFGHLAGGYDAGYYGYLWSRVYAADFFGAFREAGVVSVEVGARYRKEVLSKGSSVTESAIAKAFLGRKFSDKAFLEDIGIPVD